MRGASLALVGFMGAGKSTVGAIVARRLGWPFVDLDAWLTERHGPPGVQFVRDGEAAFRAREVEGLALWARGGPRVLALGGGACLGESNRAVLRAHYRTVYLRASLEELRRRVGQGRGRPLWDHEVAARLEARRPRYEEATVVIDTDGRSPEEVARAVLQEVACEG